MESDSQLVVRAQSGDQQAFAELVRRHSALVFRLAVSILGREFIPEAEDVAQEVFLKVHHAIESFRAEAEFSSWVYRIAFNQAVNLKARVRFRRPHADETVLYRAATPEPGPDRQAETAQRDLALADCIRTLPEVYQSALRLYYWLGAGVGEVAVLLGVPENTAKSYLHRGRQLLHGMLKEKGYILVTEMEPRETGIDSLLRRSMAAPVPSLSPDFDQRLMREVNRSSQPRDRYRRILLTGYGLVSVVTSALVMRGQGLDWGAMAVMILGPLALVATVPWARRAIHTTMRHSAK